ncbi:MAG: NUDIX domain-containing protein [Caldisericia bacterium]|nr:NUDIX domain-containing protein [Caldisericia bacterium]
MKKLISSGGVIINKDKVLLLKRDKSWVFPKGKLKENENIVQAARREIFEEAGINVNEPICCLGITKYKYKKNSELFYKEVNYFLFITEDLDVIIEKSFIGFGWFYFNEALKFITYKNDKRILKIAIKKLREANLPPLIEK